MTTSTQADLALLRALVVGLKTSASAMHLHLGALRDELMKLGVLTAPPVSAGLEAVHQELRRAERLAVGYERLTVSPELERSRQSPDALLDQAITGSSEHLRESGAALARFGAKAMGHFDLDPAAVTWVFSTLFRTSVAAAGRGGTVTLMTDADAAGWGVRFVDTGAGLPLHVAERLFDAGFAEGPGDRAAFGFLRHVVVAHGGDITCVSAEGAGTCITVRLPKVGA